MYPIVLVQFSPMQRLFQLLSIFILLFALMPRAQAANVTLAWDATDPAPDGYRVYQRLQGRSYNDGQSACQSQTTDCSINNLDPNTTYFFTVRAFVGQTESGNSNEISYTTDPVVIETFNITASAGANGRITPSGNVSVERGQSQAFTIRADTGYTIADVLVDGTSVGAVNTHTFENVTGDRRISASFQTAVDPGNDNVDPGNDNVDPGNDNVDPGNDNVDPGNDNVDPGNDVVDPGNDVVDPGNPHLEVGRIQINSSWKRFNFETTFDEPVVVAGPMGMKGGQPAVIRIRNVTSSGFDIRIQEWPCLDGRHLLETATYMVMERGSYTLADGTRLEASLFTMDRNAGTQPVLFEQSYNQTPVVAASVVSFNTTDAVVGRVGSIDSEGFEYRLQTQESGPSATAAENIAYIAWEPSSGTLGGLSYMIDTTADVVTDGLHSIRFSANQGQSPGFIADMQSLNDDDTAGLRWKSLNSTSASVLVDEEQSDDGEVRHRSEVVGYMVLTPGVTGSSPSGGSSGPSPSPGTDPPPVPDTEPSGGDPDPQPEPDPEPNGGDPDPQPDPDPGNGNSDPAAPRMEIGQVLIDSNWTQFKFETQGYTDPVIVIGPMSHTGGQPAVIRVRNVTPAGFEARVQEWPYLDGRHVLEVVSYIAMERGSYALADGTRLEAGHFETDGSGGAQTALFVQSYSQVPVVATSVVSFNAADAVVGRVSGISSQGFEYRPQTQEGGSADMASEKIAYIAWEPSSGTLNNRSFAVGTTADKVTHALHTIPFNNTSPCNVYPLSFIADMQSFNDPDTAGLRWKRRKATNVDVMIDEETSGDGEVRHRSEVVGYMMFSQCRSPYE